MGKISKYVFDLTTNSSGDASVTKSIIGKIDSISVDYAADMASGADITITGYIGAKSFTLYSKTDSVTDAIVRPRVVVQDNAGTDIDLSDTEGGNTAQYEHYAVDAVNVTIAQGGDTKECAVTILAEE